MADTKKTAAADAARNEFDQETKGNSLGRDAWRRLKKNHMAVVSIVVVALYAFLSLTASILPIYSYKEIILDHQHLPPSFTKSAGELMMIKKKQDLYYMAYKGGRVPLPAEEVARVKEMSPNQVWDYFYAMGEAGQIELNTSEKQTLERLQTKIDTELLFEVKRIFYTDAAGKVMNISRLDHEKLAEIYATLTSATYESVIERTTTEVNQKVTNEVKVQNASVPAEELARLVEEAVENLSDRNYAKYMRENLFSKIEALAKRVADGQLKEVVKDPTVEFPLKRTFAVSETISADVEASKKHARQYYFGTDYSGRDMLSRIIYGGQVSIAIGLIGTITSVLIGIVLGALAGYLGGKTDYIIMRIVDIMYGLPYMLLVIIFMAVFGRNILNLFFALAVVSWLTVARMVRGQIISLKNSEFVEAARSMGASTGRIVFRHLVPNSLSVIIVFTTLRIPAFIMMESFLSFLGLGVQAPYSSWGSLVGDAVEGMTLYPWRLIFPAIAMTIFLFAMNFLGDGLRDAFDPQSKNQL